MAQALEKLINEPDTRAAMSNAAPASIFRKGMTREAMLDSHRDLYRNAIEGRRSHSEFR